MSSRAVQQNIHIVQTYTPSQAASPEAVALAKRITIAYLQLGIFSDKSPAFLKAQVEKRITMVTNYSVHGVRESEMKVRATAHILIEKGSFSKEEIQELARMCGYKLTWNGMQVDLQMIQKNDNLK